MKCYIIFTAITKEDGNLEISYKRDLFLFREHAFKKAKELGECACVLEFHQSKSWNLEQIKETEEAEKYGSGYFE